MLTYLQIRDFAIIDALELNLRSGLTVLTGETGAGKSILVDALQLLAGGRAGAEVVRHGSERADITGTFDLTRTPRELKRWLEEQSITTGDELSIRRVVSSDGRSRAYMNGQAIATQLLREAGNILIDIHGQHEFQSLTRTAAQRELLDVYGRLEPAAGQVGISHRVWLELLNRTLELESKARDRDAKVELLRYQVSELSALQLKDGEFESLVDERARLANRGKLAEATETALQLLYEGEEGSAHAGVSRALQLLRGLEAVDPKLAAMVPLVDEAAIQIREAARELSHYRDGLELDTSRQDQVEKRLAAIEELARKNRVTPLELAGRATQLVAELETVERADMDLAVLRKDKAVALEEFRTLAAQLSAKRTTAGRALAKDITTRMQTLGMTGGRFQVDVSQDGSAEPTQHGIDQIEFRVTANPGQPLRALSKVASGGELSRLSLAVQVSCAARETRCMVFDEVDSGIGGAVAEIVGRELRALGESGQVLCVTHLPQVASQAHHHLRVAKSTDGRTTRTALTELAPQERVEEIARMLGGIEVTGKAREHAREMLRTHLELPADPSPTDRMPALKAKDLLAQAKIAAQSAKEAGGVEPKDVGVDPRATADAGGAEPKAIGAGARAAATATKTVGADPRDIAANMKDVGFDPRDTTAGMKGVGFDPRDTAAGMKGVGFEPRDTVAGIKTGGFDPRDTAAGMKGVGFDPRVTAVGTKGVGVDQRANAARAQISSRVPRSSGPRAPSKPAEYADTKPDSAARPVAAQRGTGAGEGADKVTVGNAPARDIKAARSAPGKTTVAGGAVGLTTAAAAVPAGGMTAGAATGIAAPAAATTAAPAAATTAAPAAATTAAPAAATTPGPAAATTSGAAAATTSGAALGTAGPAAATTAGVATSTAAATAGPMGPPTSGAAGPTTGGAAAAPAAGGAAGPAGPATGVGHTARNPPGSAGSVSDKVIDLSAAKAAGRPVAKRR